jgi:hypothetical protein
LIIYLLFGWLPIGSRALDIAGSEALEALERVEEGI